MRPMGELITLLSNPMVGGDIRGEVSRVTANSSDVGPGTVFVAVSGTRVDGHHFVGEALGRGAAALVVSRPVGDVGVPVIQVEDTRQALALLAAALSGDASARVPVVGVTGTNGKTTTTYLVEAFLRAASGSPLVMGTVEIRQGNWVHPATHTTPDPVALHTLIGERVALGATQVVMEVSSHALDQRRVDGVHFDAAVFTNLSRDHLDYHLTMDRYLEAKARFFREVLPRWGKGVARPIIHGGDEAGRRLLAEFPNAWSFGEGEGFHIHPTRVQMNIDGISTHLVTPAGEIDVELPLVGRHNLQNLMGAVGAALSVGVPLGKIAEGAATASVPGRLERVSRGDIRVFVDYAHSSDALDRVTAELKRLTPGRLITLFGCGGDRDRGKRPLMAAAAARHSDGLVVTSDNPRSEDPRAIVEEILPGLPSHWCLAFDEEEAGGRYRVELDRRLAIQQAIRWARPGDTVLLAGKGHETTQQIGAEKFPFDDRVEARKILGEQV